MKKILRAWMDVLFGEKLELRVRLFHVLGITGFIICITMTVISFFGQMWANMAINMGTGLATLFLLIYSARTQRYQFCYGASIGVIFLILFPSLFFSGGGYRGGMPFFFVFAMVFTAYMLDGRSMPIVVGLELIYYAGLCVIAYHWPQLVVPFASEKAVVKDTIIGLSAVGISLGATMFVQMQMYRRQQSELEEAQKRAESANRAKSVFLANMSHEIRTPIHMILGMNEIIHRESRNAQVLEYSEKIDEVSKMLLSLVDSVLDVSKIESGKTELISAPYETGDLVQTLSLIGWTNCKKKGLSFQTEIAEDLQPTLYGDLPHIRQIASNFLSNAAKYTEKGTVTLEIGQEPSLGEGEVLLCISVQDTGVGIRQEAIPTLFEAFTRADLAAHRYIEGTGLGLTIVKGLTDLMGGSLSVTSEVGKGSNFTVKLPQKIIYGAPGAQSREQMNFTAPQARILVVDDNEGNRMLMEELLAPSRATVDTADSGPACLRMAAEHTYHLILMDYMMPGMDGLETMERLRQLPGFRTPVIALTADAASETGEKLRAGGFAACLTKPVPWRNLKEAVLACLPEELVTLVPEEESREEHRGCDEEITELLEPYGILPGEAMQYFENSMDRYLITAELFLRYDEGERRKVQALWEAGDYAGLRYPVHSLKGKAGNLGIVRLAGLCAYLEKLCAEEKREELDSILPYLMYLWRRSHDGLALLLRHRKPPRRSSGRKAEPEELPELLRQLRRKPSLECIRVLMEEEASQEGRSRLESVQRRVERIDFEGAAEEYTAYLNWKNGGAER